MIEEATLLSHRARGLSLAAQRRLPVASQYQGFAEVGGLMSYGADLPDLFRRATTYVDKILKGAKPGDRPVEQPTKFELVINRKTAKALGLRILPSVLARADQVIEMMDRRAFLGILGILAVRRAAEAQSAGKVPKVGFLRSGPPPQAFVDGFRQGLRELGYVEGQNIILEYRFADRGTAELADLGSELLRLKVDVIVASATPAALAAKNLTRTVPIVFAGVLDPVDSGVVSGLSRPGGNATGTSFMSIDLATKRVELLKEIAPHLSRLAVLGNLAHPSYASQIRAIETGARSLGVHVDSIGVRGPNDFGAAFRAARKAQALIQLDDVLFTNHRSSLATLAIVNRLPAVYGFREHVEAGGLVSYGADFRELYRRAAVFVDKILKGAKPGDLPVEQPTKFELVINLKTAKALGLTIPPSLLARADRVIE